MAVMKCSECDYYLSFKSITPSDKRNNGQCILKPPVPVLDGPTQHSIRPEIDPDWEPCSEKKPAI